MQTAHDIVKKFTADHTIDMTDFWTWFRDADHTETEANVHDSQFLRLMKEYVEQRDNPPE